MIENNDTYKVSVRLMTYMHEQFIAKAMDGIMMQKTNFKIEVVVGDDFSEDETLHIIKSYKNTENIHIKILDRKKGDTYWNKRQRLGRLYNFINILENCTGNYIAILDGDDYWTDPFKLQKQVDFLEENSEYIVCSHNAKIIDENNTVLQEKKLSKLTNNREYSSLDLKKGAFLLTVAMVFKNSIKEFPKSFYTVKNADTFLISILGQHGKGMYLENIEPAMYRVHNGGVWSTLDQNKKWLYNFNSYNTIKRYYRQREDFITTKELDVKLKWINKKLFKTIHLETSLKDYLKITYYYVIYNKVLQSYSKTKTSAKTLLKYLYKKITYKSNG